MTSGDFAIGLVTIITGLAIADMVVSLHGLLLNRRRVTWDWLAMLTALFIFLVIVATWGIYFRDMANQQANPPLWRFSLKLAQAIAIYLAARASLPDEVAGDGLRLADHYAEVSRYIWVSMAFTYSLYIGFNLANSGPESLVGPYVSPAAQLLLMLVLIAVPNRRAHALLVPIIVLLFCYDHLTSPMFA